MVWLPRAVALRIAAYLLEVDLRRRAAGSEPFLDFLIEH
ncbi:hypothetical protein J2Z50_000722 [Ensifer mexicanus]|nr:hypothetical protein [Sinorhizobium mexicanum]